MAELNGIGSSVKLADGPHRIKFTTRRLVEIERRYGGFEELQKILVPKLLEVTSALLWAAGKGETEDEAMDAMDGVPTMELAQTLMVEYVRAYAGDDAADKAAKVQADAQADANGSAPDPTNGATPHTIDVEMDVEMAASPSTS